MGVDLRVITGHRLSAAEVLDFGRIINNDPILQEFDFIIGPPKALKDWHETASVEQLIAQWKYDLGIANDKQNDLHPDNEADSPYWNSFDFEKANDYINFHPQIVKTVGWYRRFRVMEDKAHRQLICAYYNRFAQLFQQKHVIFFADSSLPSHFIEYEYARSIDDLLEMIRKEFGFKQLSDMTDQFFEALGLYIHTVKY
jgi:hypothetical protein